ncbi:hypothetical protein PF005_g22844 [Phytophthora fragariae]|uniref:Uncharacterized protein n=1 Tax=Phytophthora fragariae TaxID=53985 RepID=A0A6A3Q822_9STRA|nr:hypothetical protein PF003_g37939 [Phytophthora fragariae]KAE8922377.1 hypothetical protein PF009_g27361 [Phytophthora fragariae]KAE8975377.1 hypothetical protein PF011_g24499 [Phytophthora fragariae]KAE9070415.1 hypothetical protein PF010_g26286 [Phytophthora fragariae]KAE9070968.1 hypothetical protein PF007_g26733 [Phytophthora fragariae]
MVGGASSFGAIALLATSSPETFFGWAPPAFKRAEPTVSEATPCDSLLASGMAQITMAADAREPGARQALASWRCERCLGATASCVACSRTCFRMKP